MQLDSIIYDVTTLKTALTQEFIDNSPSFNALYSSDTATSLVNTLSSYGAMLQYQLVSAVANSYVDTMYSPAGIYQLAETLGNTLHGNISAELTCDVTRTTAGLLNVRDVVIPSGCEFDVSGITFFNLDAIVFPSIGNTVSDVRLTQGKLITTERVCGGIAGEKIYFSEGFKCNTNVISVYVNGELWNTDDTFLPYLATDSVYSDSYKVFVLRTAPDGRSYLKVGNGSTGLIPPEGATITIKYITNDGAGGNLDNNDLKITLVTPLFFTSTSNQQVQLEVVMGNASSAVGGFDAQSLEVLQASSPYIFASGERAIRRDDYKALLLNKCGYLTCNVWGEYEEAAMQGGYDKIMMNMVYYSGVKAMQNYDLLPLTTVDLSSADLNLVTTDPGSYETGDLVFYPIDTMISGVRGFAGSYVITISSYDDKNQPISVNYADRYGTGILTYDDDNNPAFTKENVNGALYPVNSWKQRKDDEHGLIIHSDRDPAEYEGTVSDPRNLIYDGTVTPYVSPTQTGGSPLSFDYPFQIRIGDASRQIAAFSFKAPAKEDHIGQYPQSFAIYATTTQYKDADFINIKNNSSWDRITELQSFPRGAVSSGDWSQWVTTGCYVPSTDATTETKAYDYTINISDTMITPKAYTAAYESAAGVIAGTAPEVGTTLYNSANGQVVAWTDDEIWETVTEDSAGDTYTTSHWKSYSTFVIEVYSTPDSSSGVADTVALDGIKTIYAGEASTIWYDNENSISLEIPVVCPMDDEGDEDLSKPREIALPASMQTYEYFYDISDVTYENGYRTGDVLQLKVPVGETKDGTTLYEYMFDVNIVNIMTQQFVVTLSAGVSKDATQILRGKEPVVVTDAPLSYAGTSSSAGAGGKISIVSNSTLSVTASYVGNYYSEVDIQSMDSPTIDQYNHFTTYMEFRQPRIKNVSIDLRLEYENVTNYLEVKSNVIGALTSAFGLTAYSMGQTLSVSDIWRTINTVPGLKRFVVLSPQEDITCHPFELVSLSEQNISIEDILTTEFK